MIFNKKSVQKFVIIGDFLRYIHLSTSYFMCPPYCLVQSLFEGVTWTKYFMFPSRSFWQSSFKYFFFFKEPVVA